MLACILLSKRKSYLVATITVFLAGVMATGEYSGLILHYPLEVFHAKGCYHEFKYLAGTGCIFITISYNILYDCVPDQYGIR